MVMEVEGAMAKGGYLDRVRKKGGPPRSRAGMVFSILIGILLAFQAEAFNRGNSDVYRAIKGEG
jgi:hypothetical protein